MMDAVRRHPHLSALAAYVALATAATWPLLARFGTAIAGEGAAWRSLWTFWWWGESVGRHASPFFCDVLRWPVGAALPLRVTNVPSAVAVLPLWSLTPGIPEVSLYNAVVLASYPLAGFATWLLARELWGDDLAAFLAGALYMVGVLHAGAAGHADAVSVWPPVYFLGLLRTVRRHGPGSPLLAGSALALAALASPAHLVVCLVGTIVLLVGWWRADRSAIVSAPFARRAALVAITFGVLAGWAYLGRAGARGLTQAPQVPGADLLSFLVPGAGSAWTRTGGAGRGATAPVTYAGYVAMALAAVAALRAKASRPWVALAIVGFALALGPYLVVAGAEFPRVLLPLSWFGIAGPVQRAGVEPAHFAWLVTLGLAVGGGAALAQVVRARPRGGAIALAVALLAVVEAWPRAMPTSSWPAPRFLRDLARDGERWAVLDATRPERQLWNQVLHRHPQLGGGVDERGAATEGAATGSAVLDALLERSSAVRTVALPPPAQRLDAVRALQQRNVRFVIVDDETLAAGRALRLPRAYAGEGLVVYEVPPIGG